MALGSRRFKAGRGRLISTLNFASKISGPGGFEFGYRFPRAHGAGFEPVRIATFFWSDHSNIFNVDKPGDAHTHTPQ